MSDEIIDHHLGDEEIADERAADHMVPENAKATESNYLLPSSIDGKVRKFLSPYTGYIFKIPEFIRNGNEKAYEPQILAIGPYHRGKNHLSAMEEHKMYFLAELLKRKGENSTDSYVSAMRKSEEKARACYVDSVNLNSNEFVEMMLLDACFIVELVRDLTPYGNRGVAIPRWIMSSLSRDLLLVENQLPFFVLQEFYDMTKDSDDRGLRDMICEFFNPEVPNRISPTTKVLICPDSKDKDKEHLLGLLYWIWIGSGKESEGDSGKPKAFDCCINFICGLFHLCQRSPRVLKTSACCSFTEDDNKRFFCSWFCSSNNWEFIRCATELKDAGIKFKKIKSNNLFRVKFKDGVMEIPTLAVYDGTESFFRNLIVYEQFYSKPTYSHVIDYVTLMDCLINTSKDVKLLRQCGIIVNGLGDDEVLANMFNRLCNNVTFYSNIYKYNEIFKKVNWHCSKRRNERMATLKQKYFNTPWAYLSFFAALLLLLLTVVQTVFSVLAYIK